MPLFSSSILMRFLTLDTFMRVGALCEILDSSEKKSRFFHFNVQNLEVAH